MFVRTWTTLILAAASAATAAGEPAPARPEVETFARLYNGTDLAGWEVRSGPAEAWAARGETLSCLAAGDSWLESAKSYSDFVLKLECRIPPGGSAGIGVRLPPEGEPRHAGLEICILDGDWADYRNLPADRGTGSISDHVAARSGAARPAGEWNSYEITCRGPLVRVVINEQTVVDASLDEHTVGEGGHASLSDRPAIGALGLGNYGPQGVEFRNIELAELSRTSKSGLSTVDVKEGEGAAAPSGGRVLVHYTGRFVDGRKFDSTYDRGGRPLALSLREVIKGWQEGIPGMKVGGRRRLIIPSALGYGRAGVPGVIPPDAHLVFDVELLEVR